MNTAERQPVGARNSLLIISRFVVSGFFFLLSACARSRVLTPVTLSVYGIIGDEVFPRTASARFMILNDPMIIPPMIYRIKNKFCFIVKWINDFDASNYFRNFFFFSV